LEAAKAWIVPRVVLTKNVSTETFYYSIQTKTFRNEDNSIELTIILNSQKFPTTSFKHTKV